MEGRSLCIRSSRRQPSSRVVTDIPHLQQEVRGHFEDRVGDEEYCQCEQILSIGDAQGLSQAVELGVPDSSSVEERQEVQQRQPWDKAPVDLQGDG